MSARKRYADDARPVEKIEFSIQREAEVADISFEVFFTPTRCDLCGDLHALTDCPELGIGA
jgi:hypothetical protein